MRKPLSMLLLAFFGLPFFLSFVAIGTNSGSNVAACCRKNGKHHCLGMSESLPAGDGDMHFRAPIEKCPYAPSVVVLPHVDPLALEPSPRMFAVVMVHPTGVVQTESKWRISRSRSRQKRGPPSILFA